MERLLVWRGQREIAFRRRPDTERLRIEEKSLDGRAS